MRLLLLLLQLEALLVSQTKLGARRSPLICSSCFPLAVQHELPLRSFVRSLVGLLVLASFWPPVCLCFVFFVDASTASTGCAAPSSFQPSSSPVVREFVVFSASAAIAATINAGSHNNNRESSKKSTQTALSEVYNALQQLRLWPAEEVWIR